MLEEIKGVGPKTIQSLKKLNILNPLDLIYYFPYRYNILKRSDIDNLVQDDRIIIDGYLEENAKIFRYGKHNDRMTFRVNIFDRIINATIFNRGFLKSKLLVGTKVTLIGKYDKEHNNIIASDIKFSLLPNYTVIEPIYHEVSGISSKQINEFVNQVYPNIKIDNMLPEYLEEKYNFIDRKDSIKEIHNPTST
ncbi:MAG TPA: hypothetical protein PLV83_06260, partial [Bacilli bacterium]|nr:hypothetical protein [Bacilli bacterium]